MSESSSSLSFTSGGEKKLKNESLRTFFSTVRTRRTSVILELGGIVFTCSATFVFLSLLDDLFSDVLAWLPLDFTTLTRDDLWTFVSERIVLVNHVLEFVCLCQHFVGEEVVLRKLELESKRHLL